MTAVMLIIALLLDRLLGESKHWHPLVGFGQLVTWIEQKLWQAKCTHIQLRWRGVLAVFLLLMPLTLITAFFASLPAVDFFVGVLLLYLAIGGRSLSEHALQVHDALTKGDINKARAMTSLLVSRDTQKLNETQLAKATIESVLENGNDAIFAALFWFMIAGAPGVVFYRLSNTLDAMWGYRNERYRYFGWAAARLDDVLNFIPARLTAFTYAVVGQFNKAIYCWRHQAYNWKSPNAGPVMAAGAGALSLQLGGTASYQGKQQQRPHLGLHHLPQTHDIQRAVSLVHRGIVLWLVVVISGGWVSVYLLYHYFNAPSGIIIP